MSCKILIEQMMQMTNVFSHDNRKCRTSDAFRLSALHKMVCKQQNNSKNYEKVGKSYRHMS